MPLVLPLFHSYNGEKSKQGCLNRRVKAVTRNKKASFKQLMLYPKIADEISNSGRLNVRIQGRAKETEEQPLKAN